MNTVLSIAISLCLSLLLFSVELINTYHTANDINIELADTNEENSTEDNKEAELEMEINIVEHNSVHQAQLSKNEHPTLGQCKLFSLHSKDIPIPPPDFS